MNGVRQEPGRDFDRIGDELVFRRALAQEGRLGPVRWLSMLLGVAGTYRKHETVDVVYERRRAADGGLALLLRDRLEAGNPRRSGSG